MQFNVAVIVGRVQRTDLLQLMQFPNDFLQLLAAVLIGESSDDLLRRVVVPQGQHVVGNFVNGVYSAASHVQHHGLANGLERMNQNIFLRFESMKKGRSLSPLPDG